MAHRIDFNGGTCNRLRPWPQRGSLRHDNPRACPGLQVPVVLGLLDTFLVGLPLDKSCLSVAVPFSLVLITASRYNRYKSPEFKQIIR